MTDKGKEILKGLTEKQSDLLKERIVKAMEMRKTFKPSDIRNDVRAMASSVDAVHVTDEQIKYGVQAMVATFTVTGMLIRGDGKTYYIAKEGKRVEE